MKMRRSVTNGYRKISVEIDDNRLRDLWSCEELSIMDIAWALDAFHREVVARAKKLGLGKRKCKTLSEADDEPTRAEIAERAEHIRRTRWTEEEHEIRLQRRDTVWEAPVLPLTTFTGEHR